MTDSIADVLARVLFGLEENASYHGDRWIRQPVDDITRLLAIVEGVVALLDGYAKFWQRASLEPTGVTEELLRKYAALLKGDGDEVQG